MKVLVYSMYDKTGTPLWVGITISIRDRIATHRCRSSWYHLVTTVAVTDGMDLDEAVDAERAWISAILPIFNRRDNPAFKVDPDAGARYLKAAKSSAA